MDEKTRTIARRYVISGRVQGVGFRYFVQRTATTAGLGGWVKNRRDGTVEAMAAGSEEQLDAFELELRRGPALSRVEHVAVSPAPMAGETEFRITR